jgi:hypothetical protein
MVMMRGELTNERRIFLSTELVGGREVGIALAAIAVSAVPFVAALPFASMPMGRNRMASAEANRHARIASVAG